MGNVCGPQDPQGTTEREATGDALILDCRSLRCPLPVLKLEKALAGASPGQRFVVLATDPVARIDIPHFCAENDHACDVTTAGDVLHFSIRAGKPATEADLL